MNLFNRFFIVLILGAFLLKVQAQEVISNYSSFANLSNISLVTDTTKKVKKIRPFFNLDARRSRFLGSWVKVNGFRFGLEIKNKYRIGIGSYSSKPVVIKDDINDHGVFQRELSFDYTKFFLDYVFFENYKWEFVASLGLGSGNSKVRITPKEWYTQEPVWQGDSVRLSDRVPLVVLGGGAEYKLTPFFGIGTGVGFRILTPNESEIGKENAKRIRETFNAVFYSFSLKIHFGPLIRYFTKKDEYIAEKEAYLRERERIKAEKMDKKLFGD